MATNNAVNTTLSGQSGTGSFAGTTSATFVTPSLDVASATSINFGGSTLSNYVSNASFTPTFTLTTPGDLSVSYSSQVGIYTRIGSLLFYSLHLVCTPTYTTGSGGVRIGGLPLTVGGSVNGYHVVQFNNGVTYPAGRTSPATSPLVGGTLSLLVVQGSALSAAGLATANTPSGTALDITITGFYFI
jgi:hypothetical protein